MRRCGWCGTKLRWWQINHCRDCRRDLAFDAPTPKHREASRWEKWLEIEPQRVEYREVDLPPTTTELEPQEYEYVEDKISLRWHDTPENDEIIDKTEEKE